MTGNPDGRVSSAGPRSDASVDPSAATVRLYDPRAARAARVSALVAGLGAHPHPFTSSSAAPLRPAQASVAVLAVDEGAKHGSFDLVRRAAAVAPVLAYADGSAGWPLAARCQVLMAGARELLDSAARDFSARLGGLLRALLSEAAARAEEELTLRAMMAPFGLVAESPAMLAIFRQVIRLSALADLPTLITGETGTGKQLLAQAVHGLDPARRTGPFVAVNCAAISAGLAEAELFGHRRGAFTGADRDRRGLVRAADGGVLFLDELGELEPGLQAKLLRGWTGEDAAGESPRARVENLFAALDALEAAARESQRRFEQEIKAIAQASVAELKAAGGDPGRSLQAVVTRGAELAARERALTEEKRALELVRRETGRMQDELVATARDDMIEVLEARKRQLEARLEEARGHDEQIEDQINQIDRQVQALRRKAKNAPKKK